MELSDKALLSMHGFQEEMLERLRQKWERRLEVCVMMGPSSRTGPDFSRIRQHLE